MDRRVYDKYVIQVVKHGSLTKAAAALGITQPALSSGLNNLEREIGITIFNRKATPIVLTAEGELYYEYIQRVRLLSDDFENRVADMRGKIENTVVIGAPVAYTDSLVADAVIKLKESNPEAKATLRSAPLSELIEMAKTGEINCFVSTSEDLPENFEKTLIKEEKIFLCIPREIAESLGGNDVNEKNGSIPAQSLSGKPFILLEEGQPMQQQIDRFLEEQGIKAERCVTVNQVSTALNLAIRGAGICFASEEALENAKDLEKIEIYPLPGTISGRKIYISYDKDLKMPNSCKELIEILAKNNK